MEQPLVSVIVPVYKAEAYLEECVESILGQTYANLEVWLVDDGSPDNCPALCDAFAQRDPRVRVIHKANGGVSSARNAALDVCTGEYITFVDSDDAIHPQAVERLLALAGAHGAEICSACPVPFSNAREAAELPTSGAVEVWRGEEALLKALEDHPATYSAWGKLYARAALRGVRFAEDVRIHEDSLFVFECACREPVFAAAELGVYFYRDTPQSASRGGFHEKYLDILTVAERMRTRVQQEFPAYGEQVRNVTVKANMALLHNLCKTYDRRWRQVEREALRAVRRNRRSFVAAIPSDRLFFRVVQYRLFWLYKLRSYWRWRHLR